MSAEPQQAPPTQDAQQQQQAPPPQQQYYVQGPPPPQAGPNQPPPPQQQQQMYYTQAPPQQIMFDPNQPQQQQQMMYYGPPPTTQGGGAVPPPGPNQQVMYYGPPPTQQQQQQQGVYYAAPPGPGPLPQQQQVVVMANNNNGGFVPSYPNQQAPPPPPQLSGTGSMLDQVFGPNGKALVKQRIEPFEMITGFETENKYDVNFENGYKAVAMEDSSFMARWCLGTARPFKMHIMFKENKQEFLTLERPYRFMFHEVRVLETMNGNKYLGKVQLRCSFCTREMNVFDENNQLMYQIISPFCEFWTFYIETPTGERVGEVKKKWSGFLKELYTDADNFGVQFPTSATANQKAVLLAATFLIDFLYFENNQPRNNNQRRQAMYF